MQRLLIFLGINLISGISYKAIEGKKLIKQKPQRSAAAKAKGNLGDFQQINCPERFAFA